MTLKLMQDQLHIS